MLVAIRSALAVLCLYLAASPAAAQPSASPALRIGDNVFVVPDKNAKSITGWLIVRAGCADEADGRCVGIAHYLEHLLFINRDSDNRSKVAMFADGSGNGWTNHRATVYFQRFPVQRPASPEQRPGSPEQRPGSGPVSNAENLDKLVGYFAGLLSDVRSGAEQAGRERNVVLQEYQQNTGRNPFARFAIERDLALMPDEPLGQRVIGSPETIKGFTPEAAKAFHDRWYARNNAALVVHGPIDAKDVEPIVARHISQLPAKAIPENIWKAPRSYSALGQTLRSTAKDARQTAIYFDRIVTFAETESEQPVNDAANAVLAGYLSSRLNGSPTEILVERDGLVTEVRIGVSRIRNGTFRLWFSAVPAPGENADTILKAARGYIDGLAASGLEAKTVDRLKLRITNERNLVAEQPALYANALTNWLSSHGTYENWARRPERQAALTVEHVNRFLRLTTGTGRELAAILEPDPSVANPAAGAPQPSPLSATPEPSSQQ